MTVGMLLPRSTDFTAISFDMLDGLRLRLKFDGLDDVRFATENIGFGDNKKDIYAKAEKLLMQDDAEYVVGYLSHANAEMLYPLFETTGKMLIVLDPGMHFPSATPSAQALHISFQGMHASYMSALKAGERGSDIMMATSFYDGGYRGPWAYGQGVAASGGKIVHNYIGHYKVSEFTIAPFLEGLSQRNVTRVAACFSTYLSTLFVNALKAEASLPELEFYCSPYMFEEQTMATYNLPGGKFYGYIPWASMLDNEQNHSFTQEVADKKKKTANLFHLMGWEAGIVIALLQKQGINSLSQDALADLSYDSPRGKVKVHPETQITYAPLYFAEMIQGGAAPELVIHTQFDVDGAEHKRMLNDTPEGVSSGWVNQYLCS
jgi:branched-chain amino acid transport system substrate-binding protein